MHVNHFNINPLSIHTSVDVKRNYANADPGGDVYLGKPKPMEEIMKKHYACLLCCLLVSVMLMGCEDPPNREDLKGIRPIVFVHGLAGSADQFEDQFLRFASNGYPENYFTGFDHNSLVDRNRIERLDATIDAVLASTGADMVDLAGHSMGTSISQDYLSDPDRAAKIAHYVNIDGNGADALPGGVPTLNIMATFTDEIPDAVNVHLENNTHVQAASSPVAFSEIYEFFTGNSPATTEILPSTDKSISLSGRVVNFVTNTVAEGGIMSIYQVNPATGQRIRQTPDYDEPLDENGNFSFTNAKQGSAYEFQVSREIDPEQGHYYYEPFVRSDSVIRLKYAEPGSPLYNRIDRSAETAAVVIVRNREMQGNNDNGAGVDSLKINGSEICQGILPGSSDINESGPIGLMVFDEDSDGQSDLAQIGSTMEYMPFINSIDLVMTATDSADETLSIVEVDRYSGRTQTITVPNWASETHTIMAQFLCH